MAILISDNIDFKTRNVRNNKYFIIIKWSIHKEDIRNNRTLKFIKIKSDRIKRRNAKFNNN